MTYANQFIPAPQGVVPSCRHCGTKGTPFVCPDCSLCVNCLGGCPECNPMRNARRLALSTRTTIRRKSP